MTILRLNKLNSISDIEIDARMPVDSSELKIAVRVTIIRLRICMRKGSSKPSAGIGEG